MRMIRSVQVPCPANSLKGGREISDPSISSSKFVDSSNSESAIAVGSLPKLSQRPPIKGPRRNG